MILLSTGPLVSSSTALLSTDPTFSCTLSTASRDVSVTCREHDPSEALSFTALLIYERGQPSLCRSGSSAILPPILRVKTRLFGTVLSRKQTAHSVLACSFLRFQPEKFDRFDDPKLIRQNDHNSHVKTKKKPALREQFARASQIRGCKFRWKFEKLSAKHRRNSVCSRYYLFNVRGSLFGPMFSWVAN